MSKKLQKLASRLERKAQGRVLTIKRVVQEYSDAAQTSEAADITGQTERQHKIERAVEEYNEVHKALKRLAKKIKPKKKRNIAFRSQN